MSKVYDIGLQRYRDYEIIVCGKNSIPFKEKGLKYEALTSNTFKGTVVKWICQYINGD